MTVTRKRPSGLRSSAAVTLAVAFAAPIGCKGPEPAEELVLVPRPAEPEPNAAPRYLLLATTGLTVPATGTGHVELWLPLPASDDFQVVQSLAFEVGPPGTYVVEESPAGDRVLHVAGPGPAPVSIRALLERARATPATLPPDLAALESLEPTEWAEAATARGAQARVAQGLELTADGQTVERRWPEVLIDGAWTAVPAGAADGRIRLADAAPRATLDGQPVEVRTSYSIERR